MLKNAYLLAKIGADTAENEQHFANIRAMQPGEHVGEAGEAAPMDKDEFAHGSAHFHT